MPKPTMGRGGCLAARLALAAIASAPGTAQEPAPDPHEPPASQTPVPKSKKQRPNELELEASVGSVYSSNPFHYSDADLDDFDRKRGEGERFDGLDSEWDLITTVGLEGTLKIPLDKRRKVRLSLGGEHHAFLENSIGDYSELDAAAGYDFTRYDHGRLKLSYTPSRFKKNYRLPSGEFDAAEYEQMGFVIDYERELTKDWSAGIGVGHVERDFNSEFRSRDREGDSIFAFTELELSRDVTLGLELAYDEFETDTEVRDGILIDRSYEQWSLEPELRTTLGEWDVRFRLDYRQREYTTDESDDDGRFGREDDRYGVRIKASKELAVDGLELSWLIGWRRNDANPRDSSIPTDETGYEEFLAGLGLRLSF